MFLGYDSDGPIQLNLDSLGHIQRISEYVIIQNNNNAIIHLHKEAKGKHYYLFLITTTKTLLDRIAPFILKINIIAFALSIFLTVGSFILASTFPENPIYQDLANTTSLIFVYTLLTIFILTSLLLLLAYLKTKRFWKNTERIEELLDKNFGTAKKEVQYSIPNNIREYLDELREIRTNLTKNHNPKK